MLTKYSTLLIIYLLNYLPVIFGDWMINNIESAEMIEEGSLMRGDLWRADGDYTQNATCISTNPCLNDADCGFKGLCKTGRICECTCGEKALCIVPAISLLVETLSGSPQSKCGGLQNACNVTTNLCECEKAYKNAGFKNTTDAIQKICAPAKKCASNNDCFGMTCLLGYCECH